MAGKEPTSSELSEEEEHLKKLKSPTMRPPSRKGKWEEMMKRLREETEWREEERKEWEEERKRRREETEELMKQIKQLRERVMEWQRREEKSSSSVSNILNTIHEKLDEVECAGEKSVVINGQQALSFDWESYGLKMEIPVHAAGQSGAPPLEIGIVALISGPFEFPPGTQLVSGVYAIASSQKPCQPVLLLMEHCADLQASEETMPLHFVRASCSQPTRPYQFQYLNHGDFPISSRYGSIELERFSMLAIVRRIVRLVAPRTHQSLVFYKAHIYREREAPRRWVTLFGVTKGLQLHEQHINRWYRSATFSSTFEFKFEKEEIELVFEEEEVTKDHWTIFPDTHPCKVVQEAVDELGGTSHAPTTRRIIAEAEPRAAKNLKYRVPVTGTHIDGFKFLIEAFLPDSASPETPAASVIETSGHSSSSVISASRTSLAWPVITDTLTQAMASASVSETSTSGTSPGQPTITDITTMASTKVSETSSQSSTVIGTGGTSPGQPVLTDTATQAAMAAASVSKASGHGIVMTTSGVFPDDPTSTEILTIDDIHDVREALAGFKLAQWKVLGRQLGLGEELLDEIQADYQRDGVRECLNEVLAHWLKENYHEARFGSPTWQNLANAVKKSGDTALAAKILGAHCQN